MEELDSGSFIGEHLPCIASSLVGKGLGFKSCESSDGLAVYEHEADNGDLWYDGYCWSCNQGFSKNQIHSSDVAGELGIEGASLKVIDRKKFPKKENKKPMTKSEITSFIEAHSYSSGNYRGIKDEYSKFFGHMVAKDSSGKVTAQYYPETKAGKLVGYKCRNHPKDFRYGKLGLTGLSCELSGQVKFKSGDKYILIVGGEADKVAAYQMLRESQKDRGQEEFNPVAVVSPTTGEGSAYKQIAAQYDFLDQFDNIIIGMDNDEAGKEATKKIIEVLPKEKVKVATWTDKDPNKMLNLNMTKQFVRDFYGAKAVASSSIIESTELDKLLEKELLLKKIPLPPFMSVLEKMMAGGIPLGYIINITAETGIGKCHGAGTPILMSDMSRKKVEEVVEGDFVMGQDGSPRKVVMTHSGTDTLYRVNQVKGDAYTTNSKHLLSLRAGFDCLDSGIKAGEVINISVEDYLKLGNKAKRSLKGYKADLKLLGDGSERVEDPYMLGLWLADGTASKPQITFNNDDLELISEFRKFIDSKGYKESCHKGNDKDGCITLDATGGFKVWLKDLGVLNNKHIPNKYLTACYEDRLDLLAGILDGDGYKTNSGFEIVQKNVELAQGIVDLARSLGLMVSVSDKFSKCQGFEGGNYKRMFIFGETKKIPNRLSRKKCGERLINKNPTSMGVSIEEIGIGEYFGFQVDGDNLYCLGDFTVTHNTSLVNEMLYYWIFNSPHKMGVVSLELSAAQYGIAILSRHLKRKLTLFEDGADAVKFINTPEALDKRKELWENEYGESRWDLIDERDGTLAELQRQCEILIKKHDCKFLVLDPLQDILDGHSMEEQSVFIKWQKQIVKGGITFININHVRKIGAVQKDKDGNNILRQLAEDDIHGTSAIAKSGGANIFLTRDKTAEDEVKKNTTNVITTKIRWTGKTGVAGKWYYDNESHTLHDYLTYFGEE